MKANNNVTLQDLLNQRSEPFQVSGTPTQMSYECNIDGDFEHPSQFADLVSVLENANEGDHVRLSLCTDGGALHSILPLLGAMEMTQAHVHVHAASDVASAGTFLLMKAHSLSMNDYVTIMFHEISYGVMGQGSKIAGHVAHTAKSSKRLIEDMYQFFFSEEELERLLSGVEFYMDKEEFVERYEKRIEMLYGDEEQPCKGCSCNELPEAMVPEECEVHEVKVFADSPPRKIRVKKP